MVEVVENLQFEDSDIPVKEVSLEEGETLHDSASDITYSEEAELTVDKNEHLNKRLDEEPQQLPPSKWSNLARAFHLGLAHDTHMPNTSPKDVVKSMQQEMKTMDKRGSLGKMFRHGLPNFQNRPSSGNERVKSEMEISQPPAETSQNTEKGTKWNIFKFGKSHHHVPGSQDGDENAALKDDEKRRPLSRILHIRSRNPKGEQHNMFGALGGTSNQGRMPSPESRGHSLGKFFRHNKNPPNLKNFVSCPEEPISEKKSEIELHENI